MAKRRKITTPSAEELGKIEKEFRRETISKPNPAMAPISQVSAETAHAQPVVAAEARIQTAKNDADAKRFRKATEQGRVIEAIPTQLIQSDVQVRDRTVIHQEEMDELKSSILEYGVRLPIEVFSYGGENAYALLSGFRRLRAVKELYDETREERFKTIPGLVKDPATLGGGFTAMVEENEIRASLSHFERGRIAVIAAQRGAFASTEDAVAQLFKSASKAKRSKIRSFSVIFEELGDLLTQAEALKERDGLRLASALRAGAGGKLRLALDSVQAHTPETEWAAMLPTIAETEKGVGSRTGRPKKRTAHKVLSETDLPNGVKMRGESHDGDYIIRLKGKEVDSLLLERALACVRDGISEKEER